MTARFFSALGGITTIFSLIVLLISYANYPDDVLVYVDSVGEPLTYLSKNILFYMSLSFIVLINITIIGLRRILKNQDEEMELTQVGLGIIQIFSNLFLASSVYFISILNSGENFNYSNFGYLIYASGILLSLSVLTTVFVRLVLKK
jgi:hypothetical protein